MASSATSRNTLKQLRSADRPRAHAGSSDVEQQIFSATERLLEHTPAHELSVAQIIEEAGVARATFYFYFSSKYAVLAGLLAQVMDRIFEVVRPWLDRAPDADARDALGDSLAGAGRVWREHRRALRAVVENWRTAPELESMWLTMVDRFSTAVAMEIDRERKTKEAPAGLDSRRLAAALIWSAERLLYVGGLGEHEPVPDEDAAVEALTVLWISSIYGAYPQTPKPATRRR